MCSFIGFGQLYSSAARIDFIGTPGVFPISCVFGNTRTCVRFLSVSSAGSGCIREHAPASWNLLGRRGAAMPSCSRGVCIAVRRVAFSRRIQPSPCQLRGRFHSRKHFEGIPLIQIAPLERMTREKTRFVCLRFWLAGRGVHGRDGLFVPRGRSPERGAVGTFPGANGFPHEIETNSDSILGGFGCFGRLGRGVAAGGGCALPRGVFS